MAIDKDRLKEDATNILKGIGKFTPGGILKGLIEGKEGEILKVVRALLSGTAPGRAVEAVQILVDRYKLPESVAKRIVANEMTDANMPVDPSGSADEGFPSRPEFESSAEDTSVPPERKIKRFPGITREMISELLKDRGRRTIPLPRPITERFPDEERFYPEGPGRFPKPKPFDPLEERDFPRPRPFDPNEPIEFQFLNQGGRVEYAEGTKMASAPDPMDERNSMMEMLSERYYGKPLKDLTPK